MAVRQLHSGRNLHSCRLRGALWASMGPGEPHRPAPAGSAGSGGLCGPLWAPASPAGRLRPAPAGSGRLCGPQHVAHLRLHPSCCLLICWLTPGFLHPVFPSFCLHACYPCAFEPLHPLSFAPFSLCILCISTLRRARSRAA